MTLLGLDATAWGLLGGFLLTLLVGMVFGLLLSNVDVRVRGLREENRRLSRELGRVRARNALLLRQVNGGGDLTAVMDAVHWNRLDRP